MHFFSTSIDIRHFLCIRKPNIPIRRRVFRRSPLIPVARYLLAMSSYGGTLGNLISFVIVVFFAASIFVPIISMIIPFMVTANS
jgi:hypothetical protein